MSDDEVVWIAEGSLGSVRRGDALEHLDECELCSALVAQASRLSSHERCLVERYHVDDELGTGAMGRVYRAFDEQLGREVALKVVRSERDVSPEATRQLLDEARALARVNHPNVVTVFDVHRDGDDVLLAMELIEGVTLREWVGTATRSRQEILRLFMAAGAGLAAVHDAGLFHRDFKPANVMIDDAGHVTVLDFGLAVVGRTEGEVGGTPLYMAPEQYEGHADARADQYQFCLALLEVLSGRWPFDVRGRAPLRRSKSAERFHPDAFASLPRRLARVLRRGLAAAPEQRWPSMHALLERLRPRATRLRWLLVPAVALAPLLMLPGGLTPTPAHVIEGCEDPTGRLQSTWAPARADALRRAWLDTGRPDAGEVADKVWLRVDAIADKWINVYEVACASAEHDAKVFDARMRCLERSRQELDGLLEALARADARRLGTAARAVRRLSDPEACRTIDVGAQGAFDDPELAVEVARLEGVMARRLGLHLAGDLEGALTLAETVLEASRAIGYEPLVAEALASKTAELRALDRAEAIPVGEEAYKAARLLGHERMAWLVISDLATAYRRAGDHERAQFYFDEAGPIVERLGDPELAADLLSHQGVLYVDMGELERALEALQQADALLARVAPGTNGHGVVQRRLANLLMRLGRNDEARRLALQARETLLAAEGESNPELRGVTYLIGQLEIAAGNVDAGLAAIEQARDLMIRQLGSDSKSAVEIRGALAQASVEAGRIDRAEAELEVALAKAEAAELSAQSHAMLHRDAGRVRLARGDTDGALEHWTEALRLADSMPATAMRDRITMEIARRAAKVCEARGEPERAQALWARVPPDQREPE